MNIKLKYLFLSNGTFVIANSILLPVYALFIKSIDGGIELAGILYGLGFLSSSLTSLVVTRFHDGVRFENRVMKLNFFSRGVIWCILAVFSSIPVVIVCQILIGITDGFGSPVFNELFARNLDRKKHIKEWASWQFLSGLAITVGSVISGFIVVYLGFQILFLIMAGLAFISFFIFKTGERKSLHKKH